MLAWGVGFYQALSPCSPRPAWLALWVIYRRLSSAGDSSNRSLCTGYEKNNAYFSGYQQARDLRKRRLRTYGLHSRHVSYEDLMKHGYDSAQAWSDCWKARNLITE